MMYSLERYTSYNQEKAHPSNVEFPYLILCFFLSAESCFLLKHNLNIILNKAIYQ